MCPTGKFRSFTIAECGSDILVAGFDHMPLISTNKLVVYRVADLAMGKIAPVTSIRGNTLFLDINPSMNIKDGDVLITRSMTTSYGAMPTITSDTIVRSCNGYPFWYHLGSAKWSQIMDECDGPRDCNCGFIYHIYDCCHCTHKRVEV